MMGKKPAWKYLLHAFKISTGSAFAMYLAQNIGLAYASSVGTITLLTILTTKWETVKLSLFRMVTFAAAVLLAWAAISYFQSEWLAYGSFLFCMTLICDVIGWRSALSVNAVVCMHFLETEDFSLESVGNEFCLLLIGISVALILNLFQNNGHRKKDIIVWMRKAENSLQQSMMHLAADLSDEEGKGDVYWELKELEEQLQNYIYEANEYQNNTFQSHPGYYIDYFEMRRQQCRVLMNVYKEMHRIRQMPEPARMISEFMQKVSTYVIEKNVPAKQLQLLDELRMQMRQGPCPVSAEDFENRAMLYHILLDLQDFLGYKKKFIEELDEEQKRRYWQL